MPTRSGRSRGSGPKATRVSIRRGILLGVIGAVIAVLVFSAVNYHDLRSLWVDRDASADIVAEATARVPRPTLPAPPAAEERVVVQPRQEIATEIPVSTGGFPPQFRMERIVIGVIPEVAETRQNTAAVAKWRLDVAAMNDQYRQELTKEIRRIEAVRAAEFRTSVGEWVKIVGGAITALASVVALIRSFRKPQTSTP